MALDAAPHVATYSPRWIARRLASIVQREGVRSLWFRVWAAAGYRRTGYLVCALRAAFPPPIDLEPHIAVRMNELGADDVHAYTAFRRGARAADFHDRLARGFHCHAAWCEDRLASVTWTAMDRAILWLLDAEFDVPPGCVYLFDSFTHPDFRGQRVQSAVFAAVRATALRARLDNAVTFVIPENRANLRSREIQGFARRGTVGRIGWQSCAWYFARGGAPVIRRRSR